MAEMTHEKMLNILRRNDTYREMTYQKAVEEGYFADNATSRKDYVTLVKMYTQPTAPTPAAPVAPAAPAPAAPVAAPVAPVAPAAPLTPEQMYSAMSPYDKQMLLTDMAIPLYQNRESSNSWLSSGIGSLVVGGILSIANLMTPSVSADEASVQYAIQRHKADVVEYERIRGKSPPWVMSDDQIRSKNTSDNSPWKNLMFYTGLAALVLGGIGTGIGAKKRF